MPTGVHQHCGVGQGLYGTIGVHSVFYFADILTLYYCLHVTFEWVNQLGQCTHTEDHFQNHHVSDVDPEVPDDVHRHQL
ncbi:hypothetical protein D3C80_1893850 [compost metagenome]